MRITVFALLILLPFLSKTFAQSREIRTYSDYYPESGKPRVKAKHYFDDWSETIVFHGRYSEWSKKGVLRIDGYYDSGKQDSLLKIWDRKGKIEEESYWEEGRRDGVSRFFDRKERLRKESRFQKGIPHGICYEYHPNGNLKKVLVYENGVLNGSVSSFRRNGMPRKTRYYEHGNRVKAIGPPQEESPPENEEEPLAQKPATE